MSEAARLDIAGIGSMVVDELYRSPRILGPDEKTILRPFEDGARSHTFVGGVVLNHLGWAAALGLRVGIFGKQADDPQGRFLRAAMERSGIEHELVLDGSASSVAEIFVDDSGGRAIYMAPGATAETDAEHVRAHHAEFIRRARWLSTEVSQLPLAAALEAASIAQKAGVPVALDFDVPPVDAVPALGEESQLYALLRGAALVKPSKAAARELVPEAGDDALKLARTLRQRFGPGIVVVTDGEAGCAISSERHEGWVAARRVKAVDTTGAGDAFLGGLLSGLHYGLPLADAGRLANACGAACVEKLGAFPDDPAAARARVLELWEGPPLALRPLLHGSAHGPSGAQSESAHEALEILEAAADGLTALRLRSRASAYQRAAHIVRESEASGGRVHVTGVGKAGHVARYGAALLASTGTPANFYDANESVHGSSGQIVRGDIVIAVSASGETEELHAAIEVARNLGARVIAVTGNPNSYLARQSEALLDAGVAREGGSLGLAPRASVAAQAMVLAALAAVLERGRGFTRADFHARHPGGMLGKKSREGAP
ncbi:MAG TPA: PfkB family carbohydrate kinase [Myxococcota bacterium]|nr:PfkB family carbohydrate kinase [Myxococcota bacterium]